MQLCRSTTLSSRPLRRRWSILAAAAVAVAASLPAAALGREFSVGQAAPAFALKSPEGAPIVVEVENGRLTVTAGEERHAPEVLFLHFFQPDCLQCQAELKALQGVYDEFADRGVQVVGVAHRGDEHEVQSVADRLGVTFPLALGAGSDAAKQVAAGDAMAMLDAGGVVRFAQVGYRPPHGDEPGDEALWRENLALMVDGKPVKQASVDRERLEAGDLLPAVRLDDIVTGKPMVLAGEDGRLTFRGPDGTRIQPRAAIGLFSRYCDFTRQEMKFLQRLSEKYGDEGLFVFAIAMYPDAEATPELTRKLGVTYPVFAGYGSQLGEQYAYGCPAYIVDADGVIQYTQVGFEEADEKKYEAVIQQVLDDAAEDTDEGERPGNERP